MVRCPFFRCSGCGLGLVMRSAKASSAIAPVLHRALSRLRRRLQLRPMAGASRPSSRTRLGSRFMPSLTSYCDGLQLKEPLRA